MSETAPTDAASVMWERVLDGIRQRISVENFDTWIRPVELLSLDAGESGNVPSQRARLRVPNRFHREWVEEHYGTLLVDALRTLAGEPSMRVELLFELSETAQPQRLEHREVRRSAPPPARVTTPLPVVPKPPDTPTGLNPKYTFDQFVVGPSNDLAHAAAMAAASGKGKRYNPLFIYGGVGLGKTHLVNAVGHKFLEENASGRVLYLSAERFTNEFIWALQNHRISEFRERYRDHCDLLLIDDIQFLAGREQTQEEFFHTFNALYQADRQIVFTSDVVPQRIPETQERLISRFQWGVVADVSAPELDTRIAILRRKAEQEGIGLSQDVAEFLAQTVKSNVRELEGTLLRLAVRADLVKRPISLDLAKETMRQAMPASDKAMTVEEIQRAVAEYFHIKLADLKGHRRHRAVAYPRMIAMYLCRQRLGASYPLIGDGFGGKDHTTAINAVKRIESLVGTDSQIQQAVAAIEKKLGF